MNQKDMDTITTAASWCEIVCNEIERTEETAALLDACARVSETARLLEDDFIA